MPTTVLEKQTSKETTPQNDVYTAPVSLYENSDAYIAVFYLPGADEKSINVTINKDILTVAATSNFALPAQAVRHYTELNIGSYRRSLTLSDQVDEEKIEATFHSGLLKLLLPKSKKAQARTIAIKTV